MAEIEGELYVGLGGIGTIADYNGITRMLLGRIYA
jgi:hypothetical protein